MGRRWQNRKDEWEQAKPALKEAGRAVWEIRVWIMAIWVWGFIPGLLFGMWVS